jgi:hypothetical protein
MWERVEGRRDLVGKPESMEQLGNRSRKLAGGEGDIIKRDIPEIG